MSSSPRPRRRSVRRSILYGLLAITCPLASAFPIAGQQALTEDQKILHVLNRLGYGPRPGDLDRIRSIGLATYIDGQLNPDRVDDSALDEMLVGYPERNLSYEELLELDRPSVAYAVRNRAPALERAEAMRAQRSNGDAAPRDRLRKSFRNAEIPGPVTKTNRRYEDFEYVATRFWSAVYSERQLEQILVDFWVNHFNIQAGDPYLIADYTERAIRPHVLGKFEDLLLATATHPAMLMYLDNWLSTAPKDVVEARLAGWDPPNGEDRTLWVRRHAEYLEQANGLNENYGRELMELHTISVDGGYTQQDVEAVASAFTGWTVTGTRQEGTFEFNPLLHIEGDKIVLGQTIPSGGMDEGLQILQMLARHPSTARFIATKLVRRLVADDPPADIVEAASDRFLETGGDLREVVRTIVMHPRFFSPEFYQAKVKKPLEVVASTLRAVDADLDTNFLGPNLGQVSGRMGEGLYQHEAPDGYPDVASAWMSTNSLFQRLRYAMDVASESLPALRVDLEGARSLFERLGYPEPTAQQIADARELFKAMQAEGAGEGGMMSQDMDSMDPTMNRAPTEREEERPELDYDSLEARVVAVALVLGSPDFQKK